MLTIQLATGSLKSPKVASVGCHLTADLKVPLDRVVAGLSVLAGRLPPAPLSLYLPRGEPFAATKR